MNAKEPEYGPGLRKLKASLDLSDAEAGQLAAGYSDKALSGPAEFVATLLAGVSNPELALRFGAGNAAKIQREIKKVLREVKAVLVAGGPHALGRYLDAHPLKRHFN